MSTTWAGDAIALSLPDDSSDSVKNEFMSLVDGENRRYGKPIWTIVDYEAVYPLDGGFQPKVYYESLIAIAKWLHTRGILTTAVYGFMQRLDMRHGPSCAGGIVVTDQSVAISILDEDGGTYHSTHILYGDRD